MSEPHRPLPDALLERYLAGDLSGEALARFEAALAASPAERARVEALRADSAAFLISHPPGRLAAKLEPARRSWWVWVPAVFVPVAAALFLFLRTPVEDDSLTKGTVALTAFRQTASGAEALAPGTAVHAADRIRFSVTAGDGYVAILSKDGSGKVSVYYPYAATQAAPFEARAPLLPGAIGLDDVKGRERLWAVHGARPFELSPLTKQLEAGAEPNGPGLTTAVIEWVKE
jgi:hypothetical protein